MVRAEKWSSRFSSSACSPSTAAIPTVWTLRSVSSRDRSRIWQTLMACDGMQATTKLLWQATEIRRKSRPTLLRSEEHTSELQSQFHLVCRLLLEKKKKQKHNTTTPTTH